MNVRPFSGVAREAIRCLLLTFFLSGCVTTSKNVEKEDWGAIPEGQEIVVTTLDGSRTTLRTVAVYESYLAGAQEESATGQQRRIPLDSVEFLEIRKTDLGRVLVLATAVAAGVAISAALGEDDTRPPPRPPVISSCPLVYSYNGTGYVLDSETYSGAVAQGLERTDMDNLEGLSEVGGRYHLLMANSRPETQYTDEVALLFLDHPEEARVFPDPEGTLHILKDLSPPISARGLRGGDALSEVSAEDDRSWNGAPVEEADPFVDEDLRDGLVVTFPRPAEGRPYLMVRAKNSQLAPFAIKEFLELQGDHLIPWYRRLKTDEELRAQVLGWLEREGWLQASVELDGVWMPLGTIRDVGPNLPKNQVLALDLPPDLTGPVRIKLESARGLWAVDAVMLGSGETAPPPEMVEMDSATDAGERDVPGALEETDGRYYTALEGDEVELTFVAPQPPVPGFSRSLFLRTRGFYHLQTSHAGPPRSQLAERILSEPLFGNRFLLMRWRVLNSVEVR